MKLKATQIKNKCPGCGSKLIFTQGLDQMCLDCDWNNSLMLIHLGQLDNPKLAANEHFSSASLELNEALENITEQSA